MAIEFPEATVIGRQMQEVLPGREIERVHVHERCASLIGQGFINLQQVSLAGRRIAAVTSGGKWICVWLEPDMVLLLALETGGKLLYHPGATSLPASFHVRLDLEGDSFFTEQIVGWGWARAVTRDELPQQRYPGRLGATPLAEKGFSPDTLGTILDKNAKPAVKYLLLQQEEIAGIGNGYVQDVLFRARLHPKRKVGSLSAGEREALYAAIVETMGQAVELGGRDSECDLYGRPGRYRALLSKETLGRPCPACGTPLAKISALGSASYLCPSCQKE
jgi:formamidopyrimidine-DNA glycosylase